MENFDQTAVRADLFAVKEGDNAAFERLLVRYRPLILASVRRFLARCPEADEREMEQEADLALYRAALHYAEGQKEVTFGLYAEICIHNALTSRFLRRRRKVCSLEQLEKTAHTDDAPTREQQLIEAESAEALRSEIKGVLSPLEYSVFIRYAEGEKAAHIAQSLHLPRKTVENAQSRALRKLRLLLGE